METGFSAIDGPNRALAEYLTELEKAALYNDRDAILGSLDRLVAHLETQFPQEEAVMREHGYLLLEQHIRSHNSFLRQLKRYQERHRMGENVSRRITYDLKIWLTNHIKLQDGNFSEMAGKKRRRKSGGWWRRLFG